MAAFFVLDGAFLLRFDLRKKKNILSSTNSTILDT